MVVVAWTTGIMVIFVTFLMMYRIWSARRARIQLLPTEGNHGAAVISINRRTISLQLENIPIMLVWESAHPIMWTIFLRPLDRASLSPGSFMGSHPYMRLRRIIPEYSP